MKKNKNKNKNERTLLRLPPKQPFCLLSLAWLNAPSTNINWILQVQGCHVLHLEIFIERFKPMAIHFEHFGSC